MRKAALALGCLLVAPFARPAPAAEASPVAAGAAVEPALSPDGARVAFLSDVSGAPQLWTAPASGGWPAQLTRGGEPVRALRWSPDGNWLAYETLGRGGAARQLYVIRPDGRSRRRFSPSGWNRLGGWSPDGLWIGFAGARRPAAFFFGLYEPRAGAVRLRRSSPAPVELMGMGPRRRRVLVRRLDPGRGWQVYLYSLRRRREILLTPHRRRASSDGALFSPSGDAVYLVTGVSTDRPALGRVRLDAGGSPGAVEILAQRADASLERLAAMPGGRWAALLWNVDGRSELSLMDLGTGRILPGPELPGEVVHGLSITPDGGRIAVSVSAPAAPPDIWILDCGTGAAEQLTSVPHGGVDLGDLVRPARVRFRSHDGVELDGWFYRAPGPAGPLVVALHDGPGGQARPSFQPLIQELVRRGISVLAPNVRGSAGRGREFAAMDDGPQRLNAIRDVVACGEWAVATGRAEPTRLGVLGRGDGGYLALAGLVERPGLFAAGVLVSGFADLEALLGRAPPWLAPLLRAEYGDPEHQRDMLRALSPIHRLDRVRTPLLLLHGRNDPLVPVEEAERIAARLEEAGVESKLVVFEDEGRRFLRRRNRLKAARLAVEWLQSRLGP